jgi:hypothetical protein
LPENHPDFSVTQITVHKELLIPKRNGRIWGKVQVYLEIDKIRGVKITWNTWRKG